MKTNENTTQDNEQLTTQPAESLSAETGDTVVNSEAVTRLQTENDELRSAIRLRDARDHITGALATAGARSPQLLFEAARDSLEFDPEGKLANSTAILRTMQKRFPEQFVAEPVTPSIDGAAGMLNRGSFLTKEALARMKPEEIAKLDWAEVRQILSSG